MNVIDLSQRRVRNPPPAMGVVLVAASLSVFWFFIGVFVGATFVLFTR